MEFLLTNMYGDYCSLEQDLGNSRRYHGLFAINMGKKRNIVLQGMELPGSNELRIVNEEFEKLTLESSSLSVKINFPYDRRKLQVRILSRKKEKNLLGLVLNSRNVHSLSYGKPEVGIRELGINRAEINAAGTKLKLEIRPDQMTRIDFGNLMPKNIELGIEESRGYDHVDTAIQINRISFRKSLEMELSLDENPKLITGLDVGAIRKGSKEDLLAARNLLFLEKHEKELFLRAGHHWFDSWGRDTFIALPFFANTLLRKGWISRELAFSLFDPYLERMRNGVVPNYVGEQCSYNSCDAGLLLIDALNELYETTGDRKAIENRIGKVDEIIDSYCCGNNVARMDKDYLIANEPQTTWMDAMVDGRPITPRNGKCVEINGLWHNAIMARMSMGKAIREQQSHSELKKISSGTRKGFGKFHCMGYLADRIMDDGNLDISIRPNQVIATGLRFSPVDSTMAANVIQTIEEKLLTPMGLRTLSMDSDGYVKRYAGTVREKDYAYHNGTVWPWLLGYYWKSCIRIGKRFKFDMTELLKPENRLIRSSIPEVYDPTYYTPDGCAAQLWSHSAMVEILNNLKKQ